MSNRLAREKSPYLLQHAHNPVDWYPWSEEAFAKAAGENKPIFLSIGYSTCHWCHVMERESFEDVAVAEILNQNFISIKVDREERPDIDGVYMNYVMSATGSGGWPMSVFLTPDKKPFYGGTYFPPEDRYGRPGFKTLLLSISEAWHTRKEDILRSADSAVAYLNQVPIPAKNTSTLNAKIFDKAFQAFDSSYDDQLGGFGQAPKFPRSHALSFLLRYSKRTGSTRALEMACETLDAMKDGGIYDQLGGGFHRYSTDNFWRIPHFEKMLYDQALLVKTYLEVFEVTGEPEYARIARETLDYVLREMTDPQGGFYSAEDADSQDLENPQEKKEGAFFLWKKEEIEALLEPEAAKAFVSFYGIQDLGNAISDPHREFQGKNVLYRAQRLEGAGLFQHSRKLLLEARSKRPRPYRDDKILSDWNGLMIESFALASQVLGEKKYAEAAIRAAEFIFHNLKEGEGRLLHRYREGEAGIQGNLNDYAFMASAYLAIYRMNSQTPWLQRARGLAEQMEALFWDSKQGGFYLTAHDAETLITRPKEVYDGAVPSANSVAALVFLRLGSVTGELRWASKAHEILAVFGSQLQNSPENFTQMLVALDEAMGSNQVCNDQTCPIPGKQEKE